MKVTANVNSSAVSQIVYDELTHEMEVTYIKGSAYRYADVPQSVFDEIIESNSVGRALQSAIKSGGYRAEKI